MRMRRGRVFGLSWVLLGPSVCLQQANGTEKSGDEGGGVEQGCREGAKE